jgi:hypothetical protein
MPQAFRGLLNSSQGLLLEIRQFLSLHYSQTYSQTGCYFNISAITETFERTKI